MLKVHGVQALLSCARHNLPSGASQKERALRPPKTMNRVFVLSKDKKILAPCKPARARILLTQKRAAVFRRYPFTIIMKNDTKREITQQIEHKIDPGKDTSGHALVSHFKRGNVVIFKMNLKQRGFQIKKDLLSRRAVRRNRRSRKTRYREARFLNRRKPEGWLPPSILHVVQTNLTWAKRFQKIANITEIHVETNRFDAQKMVNPEISGIEYQQGTLQGYDVREYLLEKWKHKCAYCGKKDVPLEVEHIVPKSRGGSNRVSNLTIACVPCNKRKDNKTALEFGFPEIQKQAKQPLAGAAHMNAIRYRIVEELRKTGLTVFSWTGSQTKMNRIKQGYPKEHWVDAACVGDTGASVIIEGLDYLSVKARGYGCRQMQLMDKYGFPRMKKNKKERAKAKERRKYYFRFKSGDIVRAIVPKGVNQGNHVGAVGCRKSGRFSISTPEGIFDGISYKHCKLVHRQDGYNYSFSNLTPSLKGGVS